LSQTRLGGFFVARTPAGGNILSRKFSLYLTIGLVSTKLHSTLRERGGSKPGSPGAAKAGSSNTRK
jgi:hypothetical protein